MSAPASDVSVARRRDVIDALRRGTVPQTGLGLFAVGLERFDASLDDDLATVARGGSAFHALRGEYGSGKTFFARWLAERAKRRGLAVSEVQISETETPLHRLETVYRRLVERLTTATHQPSALRAIVDSWFYALEEEVLDGGDIAPDDEEALAQAVDELLERRLTDVARTTPAFSAALRGYRRAVSAGDGAQAEALIAWLGGQRSVAASAKRAAGVRGTSTTSPRSPSSRASSPSCGTVDIPDCCWSSTRWRPSSGCGATYGRSPSTRCASSSTRSTPVASPDCFSSSPGPRLLRRATGRAASGTARPAPRH